MPNKFIYFSDEQKEQARMTDIAELLQRQGETLKKAGKEYVWRDGYEKVTVRGNLWFHQYDRVGGDAIDFVKRFYDMDYPQAMQYLLGGTNGTLTAAEPVKKKPPKPFELPKKNDNMRRVFAYLLSKRGIDKDVLYSFVHKDMIYESAKYHNVVFVGYDINGKAVHAHMRGTGGKSTFKGNAPNGIPEYSFHWNGTNGKLYMFEAPIDMLSFISMNQDKWKENSYAACCGVSDRVMFQILSDNPNIKTVYLCFDNDIAGEKAKKRISDKLFLKDIKTEILVPNHKDWNEDILSDEDLFDTEENDEEEEECPGLQLL